MWLLYLYFVREAVIELYELARDSLAWGFAGAERPHSPMVFRHLATILDYGMVILANGAILIVWALYNQFRFRGRDRRRPPRPVSVADLAAIYGLRAEDVAQWQQARILTMQHAPDASLFIVNSRDPVQIPSTRDQRTLSPHELRRSGLD